MDTKKIKNYAAKVRMEDNGLDRKIIARVVGVTFDGRQEFLEKLTVDTPVKLERDRRNEHDTKAVKVMALLDDVWAHIGFIPKSMRIVPKSIDKGVSLAASVYRLTGGGYCEYIEENYNYGVEINIYPE